MINSLTNSCTDSSRGQVAKWLGAPVLLVVDCWAMARSAAAMVRGYQDFDTDLCIGGLLLNRVSIAAGQGSMNL